MAAVERLSARVGERRLVAGLGGLFVAVAVVRFLVVLGPERSPTAILATDLVIGLPGAGLLYGAYRLPDTDLRPDVYPRVVSRCLAGVVVMLGVVGLLAVGGLNRPFFTPFAAAALGGFAGFVIGFNEAQALSRARDAEQAQRDLERVVERLQQSNERLEQFAYAASHDLQEPLRMVSSYLQLLERRYGEELDGEGEEFLEYAVDGADRMRAMIESLLAYSRVDRRGQPLEPTDADAVLEDVLTDLEPRIEETGATVTVDDLPTVRADPDQLAQVFRNLLSNALTYSGEEPPRVHVSAERVDGEWRFAVADEGIGIDPEYRERIFETFERLQAHGDEADPGTGVGLAICARIVERHGGDIWVDSRPGEGSTFYFTFPAADAEGSSSPRERGPAAE